MRTKRNNTAYLQHIFECTEKLIKYSTNNTEKDFHDSEWDQDAVTRNLEIIGEAANNLDEDFRENHAHIHWRKIIDLRNIVVYDYADIDIGIVWNIMTEYIPVLQEQIHDIIKSEGK